MLGCLNVRHASACRLDGTLQCCLSVVNLADKLKHVGHEAAKYIVTLKSISGQAWYLLCGETKDSNEY